MLFYQLFKTPLLAAFFCAFVMAGCNVDQQNQGTAGLQCGTGTVPIARVQGNGPISPLKGQTVTITGIVTLLQSDGIYIEQPASDQDDRTSNGIFVQTMDKPDHVEPGDRVVTHGTVAEIGRGRYGLTAITDAQAINRCSTDQPLPLTTTSLPLAGLQREALEGMRIRVTGPLTVTDIYRYNEGKFTLSGNGLAYVATEVLAPGRQSSQALQQIRNQTLPALRPAGNDENEMLSSGMVFNAVSGVMAHDGYGLRVVLQDFSVPPLTAPRVPPNATTSDLRFVAMNLHNYFNGDGKGGGFPTSRGARNRNEFAQQRNRVGAAVQELKPDLIGVTELENDGFGKHSASADFIELLNAETSTNWAVSRPAGDDTGGDQITVGIFYRSDHLEALGPARSLKGELFKRSRQPLAQVFRQGSDGAKILIVINHLKSKGSCPDAGDNADQHDGQGCWNRARTAAAGAMSVWAKALAKKAGTENILIIGDMNAYRREDPIDAIRSAGFTELMDDADQQPYSFIYGGQAGSLDYAFSSRALQPRVERTFIWHVNAAFPDHQKLPLTWLRFSDHDPVIVDLRLRQSATAD